METSGGTPPPPSTLPATLQPQLRSYSAAAAGLAPASPHTEDAAPRPPGVSGEQTG